MAKATPVWDALNEKIEAQQKAMHDTVLELMDFVKSAEMRSISMAERSVVRMHLDAAIMYHRILVERLRYLRATPMVPWEPVVAPWYREQLAKVEAEVNNLKPPAA